MQPNPKQESAAVWTDPFLPVQVGNHIDIVTRKWVAQDAGIGAGVDSYFEYLVKGAIMLQDQDLLSMFRGKTPTETRTLLLVHRQWNSF